MMPEKSTGILLFVMDLLFVRGLFLGGPMRTYTNEFGDAKRCFSSCPGTLFEPRIALIMLSLSLFIYAFAPTAAGSQVKQELEGYTLDPHEGWTTGAVKGWSEGDCIPFRYSVENKGSSAETLDLHLVFESEMDGIRGILGFESFAVPAGSIYGPYFDGDEGLYRWDVTVPGGETYVIEWCARLSDEAGLWPGASLHVSIEGGGSRDVPIMTKDLLVPDLVTRATAISECSEIIYSIHYSNLGSADQRNVTLVDDYDETKVVVIDDGGGADDGGSVTWQIGYLPSGGGGDASYKVRLRDGVEDGTIISSNSLVAGDLGETVTENNRHHIEVGARSGPDADAGPDRSVIFGGSVVIGGDPTASGGSGGYAYLWNPAEGLDDPMGPNPSASPPGTTNYTVTVIDDEGCEDRDDVRVVVEKPVSCQISGPESVCDDQPFVTFYYVGEDLLASPASFNLIWEVDGQAAGFGEEARIDWSRFDFGRHLLSLVISREDPDGSVAVGRCELSVLYVESPTASMIML